MKIKKLFPFAASAFFCSLSLSANVLYWVDATSYFTADASGKIDGTSIWNIARDFSSTEKSEYSDNYNWATGYTVKEVSAQDSVSGRRRFIMFRFTSTPQPRRFPTKIPTSISNATISRWGATLPDTGTGLPVLSHWAPIRQ